MDTLPISPDRVELPLRRIRQEKSNWCWAAAADMVSEYYDKPQVTQCALANELFGSSNCCKSDPGSSSGICNQGCDVTDVSAVYQKLEIGAQFRNAGLTLSELQSEINADRPVQVGFQWTGGGGHVVIVIGYGQDQAGDFLIVNDPLDKYQRAFVTYDSLVNAYGKGKWAWTWIGIQLNEEVPVRSTEKISEQYLCDIAAQVRTWAQRGGEEIPVDTAIELGATFSTWVLEANSIKGCERSDLVKLAKPTDRLQHQVKIGGKDAGYACSNQQSRSVSELFGSLRAEKIDKAIEWVDRNVKQKLPLQLLEVPAYQVDAFWLFDESKGQSQVLIIDAPEELANLERNRLLTSQEFLEALGKERVVTGISEKVTTEKLLAVLKGDDFSAIGAAPLKRKLLAVLEGDDFSAIGAGPLKRKVLAELEGDDFSAIGAAPLKRKLLEVLAGDDFSAIGGDNGAALGQVASKIGQLEAALFLLEGKLAYMTRILERLLRA